MSWLAALLLLISPISMALDSSDALGLSVVIDRMAEPVRVDGWSMRIQHATGADIALLARRVEQRWRREGGELGHGQHGEWQLIRRWREGRSELVQWREEGSSGQLVFSSFDTTQSDAKPSPPPFDLPGQCNWGRVIEGHVQAGQYMQRSALCRATADSVRSDLLRRLPTRGWVVTAQQKASLILAQGRLQGELYLIPGTRPGESALVWIGVRPLIGSIP